MFLNCYSSPRSLLCLLCTDYDEYNFECDNFFVDILITTYQSRYRITVNESILVNVQLREGSI